MVFDYNLNTQHHEMNHISSFFNITQSPCRQGNSSIETTISQMICSYWCESNMWICRQQQRGGCITGFWHICWFRNIRCLWIWKNKTNANVRFRAATKHSPIETSNLHIFFPTYWFLAYMLLENIKNDWKVYPTMVSCNFLLF